MKAAGVVVPPRPPSSPHLGVSHVSCYKDAGSSKKLTRSTSLAMTEKSAQLLYHRHTDKHKNEAWRKRSPVARPSFYSFYISPLRSPLRCRKPSGCQTRAPVGDLRIICTVRQLRAQSPETAGVTAVEGRTFSGTFSTKLDLRSSIYSSSMDRTGA